MAQWDSGAVALEKAEEPLWEIMDSMQRSFSFLARQQGKPLTVRGGDTVTLWWDQG